MTSTNFQQQKAAATLAKPSGPNHKADHDEDTAVARTMDRSVRRPNAPRFKVRTDNGKSNIEPDHVEPAQVLSQICDSLGTSDVYFADGLLAQIGTVARAGDSLTTRDFNVMVATVHAIGPRDPVEALIAVQMAAIHQATMVAARRLKDVGTIDQQNSASNMLNKLTRTFATQTEALKRYRSSGEQNVRVTHQHVSVTANQAVVGINQGGGGTNESQSQSHAPCRNDERGPALLSNEQEIPMSMPGASGEREECLPYARGASRGTGRQG